MEGENRFLIGGLVAGGALALITGLKKERQKRQRLGLLLALMQEPPTLGGSASGLVAESGEKPAVDDLLPLLLIMGMGTGMGRGSSSINGLLLALMLSGGL